jgi:hypothetical protein
MNGIDLCFLYFTQPDFLCKMRIYKLTRFTQIFFNLRLTVVAKNFFKTTEMFLNERRKSGVQIPFRDGIMKKSF